MEIKLDRLTLENFKGVKSFTLGVNGMSAQVHGQNGAGKTTLMDGFLWPLFGKDSSGKADFAVKTLDSAGQELHNLCHSVESVLSIDGKPLTLKKSLKERWTKKRGSPKATFQGHTTDYAVDGVPVQEKEWKARIAAIINEDTFKLLTNPAHFNSLHWQKRREILLQVCGDVSDMDVIASDRDLRDLPDILGDRTLEDHRKVLTAKKKEINDQLREIPARIDELTKSLADVSAYDPEALKVHIASLGARIQNAKADPGTSALRIQRSEIVAKVAEIQGTLDRLKENAEKALNKAIETLEDEKHRTEKRRKDIVEINLADLTFAILRNEKEMDRLRAEFLAIDRQEYSGLTLCPTCGQTIPEHQVESAKARHNQEKARKLEEIQGRGLELKAANVTAGEEKARIEATRTRLEEEIKALEAKIQTAQADKTTTLAGVGKLELKAIKDLEAEITLLDKKIAENAPVDTKPQEDEKAREEKKLAEIEASKKTRARIQTLGEEEKKLAAEYEELERQTFLLEKFIVAKVNLLEEKINQKFQLARFRLFDTQVNGGIAETCITLYEGVPFGAGLNTGAEINVGLDIIRTLSRHYGIKAPVWIDHKESVTETLDPETQTIMLVVDPDCPKLEVRS